MAEALRRWLGQAIVGLAFAAPVAAAAAEWPALPTYEGTSGSKLTPSLSLEGAFFPQSQSWFGKSRDNLGKSSTYWFEEVAKLAVDGEMGLGKVGQLYGRVSALATATQRTDAAGSDVPNDTPSDLAWEDAYLGWRSADLLNDTLGHDALDLSFGRQRYQVGSGFLFWSGAGNGGDRAAYWIGPRKAFRNAGIARLTTHGVDARAVYLEPDDNPQSNTKLYGLDLQWSDEDLGSVGGGAYHIFESDIDTRDGMDLFDVRADLTPLKRTGVLPGLTVKGEYANESNGDELRAEGWYGELGYDFADVLPWSPYLSYRYAHFSGDDPSTSNRDENFDPLFYGFNDWGTWYQGEILGEYVLLNQNLNSHTVRLAFSPTEDIKVNLIYFTFEIDDARSFGVDSSKFADEFDVAVDYTLSDNVFFSFVGAVANAHSGATDYTGGNDLWSYGMVYTNVSF